MKAPMKLDWTLERWSLGERNKSSIEGPAVIWPCYRWQIKTIRPLVHSVDRCDSLDASNVSLDLRGENPYHVFTEWLTDSVTFSGLALSHHFGVLYGYRHHERLRKNVYLAIDRANFCRTSLIVISIFGILTLSYLVLLVYLYVTQPYRPVQWLHICVVYFLGYTYCASAGVAMNLMFSAVCTAN